MHGGTGLGGQLGQHPAVSDRKPLARRAPAEHQLANVRALMDQRQAQGLADQPAMFHG